MKNTTDKTILVPLISDGPNTGFKSVPNPGYIGPRQSSSPSYTLADLKTLIAQWINEQEGDTEMLKWTMSILIEWLGKKEREANVR